MHGFLIGKRTAFRSLIELAAHRIERAGAS